MPAHVSSLRRHQLMAQPTRAARSSPTAPSTESTHTSTVNTSDTLFLHCTFKKLSHFFLYLAVSSLSPASRKQVKTGHQGSLTKVLIFFTLVPPISHTFSIACNSGRIHFQRSLFIAFPPRHHRSPLPRTPSLSPRYCTVAFPHHMMMRTRP